VESVAYCSTTALSPQGAMYSSSLPRNVV